MIGETAIVRQGCQVQRSRANLHPTNHHAQSGQALIMVLVGAVIAMILAAYVLNQSYRQRMLSQKQVIDIKFGETVSRLKQILDTTHLCTCNLKNYVIDTAQEGTIVDSSHLMRPRVSGDGLNLLGFYFLGPNLDCDLSQDLKKQDTTIYVGNANAVDYPNAIKAEQIWFHGFTRDVSPQNLPIGVERYKGEMTVVASYGESTTKLTKSNINSPVSLDVFLETSAVAGASPTVRRIDKCYAHSASANPINGSCGPANGGHYSDSSALRALPSASLCTSGTATMNLQNLWAWSCGGISGGTTQGCLAGAIVNGKCNTPPHGNSYPNLASFPVSPKCADGTTEVNFVQNAGGWDWRCDSTTGGSSALCHANQSVVNHWNLGPCDFTADPNFQIGLQVWKCADPGNNIVPDGSCPPPKPSPLSCTCGAANAVCWKAPDDGAASGGSAADQDGCTQGQVKYCKNYCTGTYCVGQGSQVGGVPPQPICDPAECASNGAQ